MRSNCILVAWRQYRQLRRSGARVALFIRPSDVDKPGLFHVGWQVYDPVLKVYRPSSYRPVVFERNLPLHALWRRWRFRGRVVAGDDPPPDTQQPTA
jgi:hypothetical protein